MSELMNAAVVHEFGAPLRIEAALHSRARGRGSCRGARSGRAQEGRCSGSTNQQHSESSEAGTSGIRCRMTVPLAACAVS